MNIKKSVNFVNCNLPKEYIRKEDFMFKPGHLYQKRKMIMEELRNMPLETGDIFYNGSNVRGPLGIPFGKLVQYFTDSIYSHATMVLIENDEYYAIDVSDYGCRKLRMIDWFDNWYVEDFMVVRLKEKKEDDDYNFQCAIYKFLDEDPSYDFTFTGKDSYYCTESVKRMYGECGYDLGGSFLVKDIVSKWFYPILQFGSLITKITSNSSLPTNVPITIVGNETKGMLSSPLTKKIIKYDGKNFTKFI